MKPLDAKVSQDEIGFVYDKLSGVHGLGKFRSWRISLKSRSMRMSSHSSRHEFVHMEAAKKLFDLTGRAALLTGGNGGIGLGMARGLAQAGAGVMIVGRDRQKSAEESSWAISLRISRPSNVEALAIAGRKTR